MEGAHRLGRRPALDGVRGIAIAMVVVVHVGIIVRSDGRNYSLGGLFGGGLFGVDVFFVLSGFLITVLLLEERQHTGRTSFVRFYTRRALRLLPALAAVLAAHVLYSIAYGQPMKRELEAVLAIFFYVGNLTLSAHKFMPLELVATWSLAVEEQFYFAWPAVFVGLCLWRARGAQRPRRAIPLLLPVGVVVSMVVRVVVWRHEGFPAGYMLPICRADALLIGCILAFAFHAGRLPRRGALAAGWLALAALAGLTVFWDSSSTVTYYGFFTVVALLGAALINAVLVGDGSRLVALLSCRPLVALGRVSYGVYLWHLVVFVLVARHLHAIGPFGWTIVGSLLTAVATAVSWFVIEQPALRLKRRFASGPAAPLRAEASA